MSVNHGYVSVSVSNRLVVGGSTAGVAFDRDDQLGEVAVADDAPELPLGFQHAGGGPAG